jgi:hypothetical protein
MAQQIVIEEITKLVVFFFLGGGRLMVRKLYIFMESHRWSIFGTSVLRLIYESQKEELERRLEA